MNNDILRDWAFRFSRSIQDTVRENFPEDKHRWPIKNDFVSKGFVWINQYLIVVLYDKNLQLPSVGLVQDLPFELPFASPSADNIRQIHSYLYQKLALRQNDALLVVPITEGNTVSERYEKFSELDKELWKVQLSLNIERQYYYVKGFDISGGFFLPPGYTHLSDYCKQFFGDNPDYTKNVFIMTKFDKDNVKLNDVLSQLRITLEKRGFKPLRADVKMYLPDRDMWNNVCVYMLCCKQGIAILENHSRQEYNPNVAIEYGFMRALNKQTFLLRDKGFPRDRADIAGKEMLSFDIGNKETISEPVETWIKEL